MIPNFPSFKPLEWSDKNYIESFTEQFPPYSDFNFTSMWAWNTSDEILHSNLNGNLVILFNDYITNYQFFSFIGIHQIEETASILLEYSEKEYGVGYLKLIPKHLINHFQNERWSVIPDKDSDDYILSVALVQEMDKLTKNNSAKAIRKFAKMYKDYSVTYNSINEVDNKIYFNLIDDWNSSKNLNGEFNNEDKALKKYFTLRQSEIKIHSLFVNGKLVAFNTCEFCSMEYAISHFSKTDKAYKGAYEVLCWEEAKHLNDLGIKHLNIEQDLGIEGLRFSKQKFKPSHFLRKYILKKSNS